MHTLKIQTLCINKCKKKKNPFKYLNITREFMHHNIVMYNMKNRCLF